MLELGINVLHILKFLYVILVRLRNNENELTFKPCNVDNCSLLRFCMNIKNNVNKWQNINLDIGWNAIDSHIEYIFCALLPTKTFLILKEAPGKKILLLMVICPEKICVMLYQLCLGSSWRC